MRAIVAIHLHHSAGSELDDPATVAAHAIGRGIGITHDPYHYHVWRQADGGELGVSRWIVSEGRDIGEDPASVRGHNAGAIAVCVHGRYDVAPLPGYAQELLVDLLVELRARYGLPVAAIVGHGEIAATACPGYDPEVIRSAVRARG